LQNKVLILELDFNENEKTMLLMLHYDVWQTGGFDSLEKV
jgi:hypothetical protein